MMNYSTPGVYVQEIPTLPPSVAQVATAIPVFIGYTEKGPKDTPTKIDTLLDYESLFGTAEPKAFNFTTKENPNSKTLSVDSVKPPKDSVDKFLMHYGLSLYFRNGGGSCYILSLGDYSKAPAKGDFLKGLTLLEQEDEPTLIVMLDAVSLTALDYYDLCKEALAHCKKLGDRFLIVDLPDGDPVTFRSKIGPDNLSYGAAYHPYLQTTLNYQYREDLVSQEGTTQPTGPYQWASADNGITVSYTGTPADDAKVTVTIAKDTASKPVSDKAEFDTSTPSALTIRISAKTPPTGTEVVQAWNTWKAANANSTGNFEIAVQGDGSATTTVTAATQLTRPAPAQGKTLAALKTENTSLYNQIKAAMGDQRVTLPPSPAIAGIYASVDRDRGVWKAPANVGVRSVIGPLKKISDAEQEGLNIDPTAGKSINAIRDFTGKGTLVWGGRTLAGNDNEWRYVSVRRLFITIEESTRKATAFAVFEPNDATTWLKVKAMIESYLYGLWQQGALAGSKPEQAYFVNVGLGKTMTAQDILEGRMNVDIGVAAVRPAEFIVLRFSHKMQEA